MMELGTTILLWRMVRLLVITSALAGLIDGRGIKNDDDDIEIFNPVPREPVIYTGAQNQQPLQYSGEGGAYLGWDLAYYSLFYPRYQTFVGTEQHLALIQSIKESNDDDIKVCINHDVTDGNMTMGAFTCPLPYEPAQFDLCCGLENAEFCCTSKSAGRTKGIAAFLIISIGVFVFGVLFYTFAGRQVGKRDSSDEFT